MSKEPVTPYKMNLPTALKERIEEAAEANRRSVSAEIITALEKAYPPDDEFNRLVRLLHKTQSQYLNARTEEERKELEELVQRVSHQLAVVAYGEDGIPTYYSSPDDD